jgi:hypothetical protein
MPGAVPNNPKVYHITHVNNLPRIIAAGGLSSDRRRIAQGLACDLVGMSSIKHRRLHQLRVDCRPNTFVGDYVPFYFCPRSIMLFILHRGNHPEVTYRGGQGPIVHLRADLAAVVRWADANRRAWAFTNGNAGAYVTTFFNDLGRLDEVNWDAVAATDFRDAVVKEGKQAEFLLQDWFPWELVEFIGVQNDSTLAAARCALAVAAHQPAVQRTTDWYY